MRVCGMLKGIVLSVIEFDEGSLKLFSPSNLYVSFNA